MVKLVNLYQFIWRCFRLWNPKKGKKKRNFTVVIETETEGEKRQFYMGARTVKAIGIVLAAILLVCVGYGMTKSSALSKEMGAHTALAAKVETLTQEKEALKTENTELSDKVTLLSEAINSKVQRETENAEKYVPNGFPLSGTATIIEAQPAAEGNTDENENAAEQTKDGGIIVNFAAAGGTAVVATGSGAVVSIADDADYGRMLTLDHGNGYITIYCCAAEPKVKEGDELTKGTMLFEIGPDGGMLGYQIKKSGEYIDPMEQIEIQG